MPHDNKTSLALPNDDKTSPNLQELHEDPVARQNGEKPERAALGNIVNKALAIVPRLSCCSLVNTKDDDEEKSPNKKVIKEYGRRSI